jgi:hypothetical protein
MNADRARRHLADFQLEQLFVEELGWDRFPGHLEVAIDGQTYDLRGVAEKRGMGAFVVESSDNALPDYPTRRKIERQAAKSVHEHLIVYADAARTSQVWQWVRREPGRPTACREIHYQRGQSGEALIQRLDAVTFTLDEEADLSIVDVTRRARAAFDVERVTKRFYDLFKAEHGAFLGFIRGLESTEDLEWYASVMLNRLMFVYFIQKKGFLDGDRDYLRNRLATVQAGAGRDQFHSFYRHFLLRLFHEGLGKRRRSSELDTLLGRVPYLNGGLFDVHELERENPGIQIPDEAFEHLFDFFDAYQWHLDDRMLRADNEINPDVLGYIFEKYVNQKQMGAYYTKEDITDYITSNTLIPRIVEKLAVSTGEFGFSAISELVAADPDRYIHEHLRHGSENDLPVKVAAGISDPRQRGQWSAAAPPSYALPTETWREVVARREHLGELRTRLAASEVASAADLVALNLNLQQLALDLIQNCDSPTLLDSIYGELVSLNVLDPTCGSGAFLFAALNILEPLYEAVLDRMFGFLADGVAGHKTAEFTAVTERVQRHPSRTFFVLKTIVVNNLYGVDIMEEAVEICKLRLFLRLVSQVDRYDQLEPLPDVDFNIRAGNAFVGFATRGAVEQAGEMALDLGGLREDIERRIEDLTVAVGEFRNSQIVAPEEAGSNAHGPGRDDKRAVEEQLHSLADVLDRYVAADYGIIGDGPAYSAWRTSHQPFHWLVHFHDVEVNGGFDVIIGNPPYVELKDVAAYTVRGFATLACGDLYALTLERADSLLAVGGWSGFIVPLSAFSVDRFKPLQDIYTRKSDALFVSSWSGDAHPAKLFEGVDKRLQIILRNKGVADRVRAHTTSYLKWYSSERQHLFATRPRYHVTDHRATVFESSLPKLGSPVAETVQSKLLAASRTMADVATGGSQLLYYTRKVSFFLQFMDRVPVVLDEDGEQREPSELKTLAFSSPELRDVALAALSSSLFYWYFIANSDCRNLNRREVLRFPFPDVDSAHVAPIQRLAERLMAEYQQNSEMRTVSYARRGRVTVQYFNFRPSKSTLDEIDLLLGPL